MHGVCEADAVCVCSPEKRQNDKGVKNRLVEPEKLHMPFYKRAKRATEDARKTKTIALRAESTISAQTGSR